MGTFDFALCFVFFVIPTNAIYNGFNATFGASFVTTYGGLTSNFGTAGILIGSRVIVQVAHNYEVEGQPYQVFRQYGTIRNVDRYTVDAYEQDWQATVWLHPSKFQRCNSTLGGLTCVQPDIAVYVLDNPVQNLCVSADSPRVIPLPFDIQTGQVTVTDEQTAPNVTRCRSYGYGYPDESRLHYAQGVFGGRSMYSSATSRVVEYMKNGTICPNDSGGPVMCKVGCDWRVMGLHSAAANCYNAVNQFVVSVDFRDPAVKDWIVQLLWNLGLTQDVLDSQQKCANTPTAWEGADGNTCDPIPPTPACPYVGKFSEWGPWSNCDIDSDEGKIRIRRRSCEKPSVAGCTKAIYGCQGRMNDAELCADSSVATTKAVPPTTAAAPTTCDAGWTAFGSYCYKKEAAYKTQADAYAACNAYGAELASIHSADEFNFALNLTPALNSGWPSIWIGLIRGTGTAFKWTDASAVDYQNWATNQPEAETSGNNCVAMYPYASGQWATANCGWQADAFVCKKISAVRAPTTPASGATAASTTINTSCTNSMFWAEWGPWSACYTADGGTFRNHTRDCISDDPACKGAGFCRGVSMVEVEC